MSKNRFRPRENHRTRSNRKKHAVDTNTNRTLRDLRTFIIIIARHTCGVYVFRDLYD